ncbi:hypothetical protein B0A48_13681 [Cryoendolithus antarcticus]|uniref:Uncharacterized protein n=1 Tax=Cryoendolithus antarcticus TaxID=1507870 RepID=A0A1V8SMN1_9PEZI|nr:hypothetical protein B0A48_13681 [Cryoendolithus antarcticus]
MYATREPTDFYPSELLAIKALFVGEQYRQCINACRQTIHISHPSDQSNPMRQAFVHFYLGLSHDELARALHEHSQAKLPAFDQAEHHFRTAMDALPSVAECRASLSKVSASMTGGSEAGKQAPVDRLFDDEDSEKVDSAISPPPEMLQRDFSSMSLLEFRPRLQKSTSQGLLRPIRPGSPPKQYHLPPKLPYIGSAQSRSYLPTLLTTNTPTYRPRSKLASYEVSPSSPVSPMGSAVFSSDISAAVSPMSAQTPVDDLPEPILQTPKKSTATAAQPLLDLSNIETHLDALCAQLQTHLRLVRTARLKTTIAQAQRSARTGSTVGTPLPRIPRGKQMGVSEPMTPATKGVVPSRSFWSFTPADVQASEKQRRIEEGRARGWKRTRFDAGRYRELAERALAEL